MLQDLRVGLRMLLRSRGFSVLAILCLTLGIGATTSVMSWVEGILLRPFPLVANEDRMVAITGMDRNGRTDVSWPDLQDLRRNSTLVESFIAEHIGGATLNVGVRAERATGSVVSSNYFDALGVRPILGRAFEPDEDVGRNAHPVAVIAYRAWKQRFNGDPEIIGKTQMLNGAKHTIIGVAPEGFHGTFVGYSFQFWVPASMEENFEGGGYKLEDRGARWIEGFAILKPGVTLERAQAEIDAIGERLAAAYPETNRGRGFKLYPLWQTPFNNAGTLLPTLRIAGVVACLVLFIACANVANLLLVRSFARRQEMTIRLSIGAWRARLLRQLLTEDLMLAVAAICGGALLAYGSRNLMTLMFPPPSAGAIVYLPSHLDWRVLVASSGVALLATLIFGMAPALDTGKLDLAGAMRSEGAAVVGGRKAWIRSGLVMMQVSISFVLLVGGGLVLQSLHAMREANVGFSTENVLNGGVDMIAAGYDGARMRNFQDELRERVQAVPGVESMVWVRNLPFTFRGYPSAAIAVDGFETKPGEQPILDYNEVGAGYFATAGIPLVSGRGFTAADNETSLPVVVVNEEMAQRFWRGQDPVGKRLEVKGRWLRVVGVARNAKYSTLLETAKPFFYIPLRQGAPGGQNFQVRTRLSPETLANALVREIKSIDPNLAPGEVITAREQVNRRTWSERAAVSLLGIFASIALLLAAIGIYGLMSYAVSQSGRELGLRMALGASASNLLRSVVARGLGLAAAGIVIGAVLALELTRLMGDLLYGVEPRDPASFAAAFVVMIFVALAASFFPALRAARTDPARALRG